MVIRVAAFCMSAEGLIEAARPCLHMDPGRDFRARAEYTRVNLLNGPAIKRINCVPLSPYQPAKCQ